ncbi:MAG: tRNA lysidine(34) synthetase TilS [Clostridia bacterium]|nr:tRNA lysidine(34) synthetase TilS [Clostridia bacterium]
MLDRVRRTAARYEMLPPGCTVIAAVSGGSDSMAMLDLLCRLQPELGFALRAAHVNHGLRGEAADADEAFVAAECEKRGVPLEILHADVAAEARRRGLGIEACGRQVRYAFFESLDANARIATAHHLEDRAETFLLNFARGASLRGLGSIPPVRGRIIRPLFDVTKDEILAYCRERGIPFVTDETNADVQYARNRLRAQVLPALQQTNEAFFAHAGACMEELRADEAYLQAQTEALLRAAASADGWDARQLAAAPDPLLRRALVRMAEVQGLPAPDRAAIARMTALLIAGGATQLPGGAVFRVRHGLAEFPSQMVQALLPQPLAQTQTVGAWRIVSRCVHKNDKNNLQRISNQVLEYRLDYDKINGKAIWRSRCPGDRLRLPGRGEKTLKKLFNELAIAPEARAGIPLLTDDCGVLLVLGVGCDARAGATAETERLLIIEAIREGVDADAGSN